MLSMSGGISDDHSAGDVRIGLRVWRAAAKSTMLLSEYNTSRDSKSDLTEF